MTNPFLTPAIARQAIDLTLPMIEAAMEKQVAMRKALHITVFLPASSLLGIDFATSTLIPPVAILAEHSIGRELWPAMNRDFEKFARSKAMVALRTGLNTETVAARPWLFVPGEFLYQGGVNHQGIIVGVSGVQGELDHSFAMAVATQCAALSQLAFKEYLSKATDPHQWFAPANFDFAALPKPAK